MRCNWCVVEGDRNREWRQLPILRSIEGVFRQDRIELLESLPADLEGKVIVTFLGAGSVDLAERGINERHAADLQCRLKTFAEDWDRPEMDIYDAV